MLPNVGDADTFATGGAVVVALGDVGEVLLRMVGVVGEEIVEGFPSVDVESVSPAVVFPEEPRARIVRALSALGDVPVLPTQAGHDAGVLSAKVPTAMLFVRNPTGVSHSPDEYAEIADCRRGAEALADVMSDWVTG